MSPGWDATHERIAATNAETRLRRAKRVVKLVAISKLGLCDETNNPNPEPYRQGVVFIFVHSSPDAESRPARSRPREDRGCHYRVQEAGEEIKADLLHDGVRNLLE